MEKIKFYGLNDGELLSSNKSNLLSAYSNQAFTSDDYSSGKFTNRQSFQDWFYNPQNNPALQQILQIQNTEETEEELEQPEDTQKTVKSTLTSSQTSSRSITPSTTLSTNQGVLQTIINTLIDSNKLSPYAIAAVIGNAQAESSLNPSAKGDGGTSYGLWQHHAIRKDNLFKYTGTNTPDVVAQTKFVLWAQELLSTLKA